MTSNNSNRNNNNKYTLNDLLKGNDLEIVAASLLLLGKLKVDSVQLYRNQPIVEVSLLGEFKSIKNSELNEMTDFLKENGNITLDEFMKGIHAQIKKGRRS